MARAFRLTPPPLTDAVDRPRLLATLRGRFDVAVTTVVASAGFGKSVLLAQAIRDNAIAPRGTDLWLSCEASDAVATNLLSGLAAAAGVDPARASGPDELLLAVAEQRPVGTCLILDDLHVIADGSPGARLVSDLVADAPPGITFVLASRTPVAGIARLRAQGRVVELGEADLAYGDDELALLAPDLTVDLGGWPALVSLVASFGYGAAREFLLEEMIGSIDPGTRRALAAIALVGGADAELGAIATGAPLDERALLELPMVTSDGTHVVPHALWGELLADELTADERSRVLADVGRALLGRGDEIRAGATFIAAGDGDGLRLAVRTACSRGFAEVPGDVLDTWWQQLGPAERGTPEALLLDALVRRTTDPFSGATRDALLAAVTAAREAGDVGLELAALWEFGYVARARGEVESMLAEIPRVLELEASGDERAVPLAGIARAVVSDAMGDHHAAVAHRQAIDESAVPHGWLGPLQFLRMLFAFYDGDTDEVRSAARAYLDATPEDFPGRVFLEPWVDWVCGRPPAAPADLPVPGTLAGSTAADVLWTGASFGIMLANAGRTDEARVAVAAANEAATSALLPHLQVLVAASRAALAVAIGDEDGARDELVATVGTEAASIAPRERAVRVALALGYVLVPELRTHWDSVELGPRHEQVRALARGVLDARRAVAPSGLDAPGALDHVVTALPLRWAAELAAGLARADPVRAREVVERLADAHGELAKDTLREVADSGAPLVADGATRLLASVPVASTGVEVRVLGPAELVVGGAVADGPDWRRGRVRALLCLLALRRRIRREEAMDLLWPDLDIDAARHNLRVTLNYLQRLIEPGRRKGEAPFYLRQEGDWLQVLDEPHVVIDVEVFERVLDRADRLRDEGQLRQALAAYDAALHLRRGGELADVIDEEWADGARQRLAARSVAAHLACAAIRLALDDAVRAAEDARAALEIDPWSEPAHRLVVSCDLARGDHPAARRSIDRCLAALDELGVSPSEETRLLERRLTDRSR